MDTSTKVLLTLGVGGLAALGLLWYVTRPEPTPAAPGEGLGRESASGAGSASPPPTSSQFPAPPAQSVAPPMTYTPVDTSNVRAEVKASGDAGIKAAVLLGDLVGLRL